MGTVLTEGRHPAEFIMSEANGRRSRDVVTVAAGADLDPGSVVGKVTATGKYKLHDPAAADGTETAAAVLLYPAKAATEDVKVTAFTRDCEVNSTGLVFKAGMDAAAIAAAVADLEAKGIIVR